MPLPFAFQAGLDSYEIDAKTLALRGEVWQVLGPALDQIVDRHIDVAVRVFPRYREQLTRDRGRYRALVVKYTERLFVRPLDENWVEDTKERVAAEIEFGHDMRTRGAVACTIVLELARILAGKRFWSRTRAVRLLDVAARLLDLDVANAVALHYHSQVREAKSSSERLERAIASFDQTVRDVRRLLGTVVSAMAASSQQVAGLVENASQRADTAVRAADSTASHISAMAGGAEQLKAAIHIVHEEAAKSAQTAEAAAHSTVSAATSMRLLSQAVTHINSMLAAVSDVAEQTNLLALNATIEAARAGASGKGFSVVAAEVKSLANRTQKLMEDIESQIRLVEEASHRSVEQIGETESTVQQITAIAQSVEQAVNEQAAATDNIAAAAAKAAGGTATVVDVLRAVEEAIRQTHETTSHVVALSQELSRRAGELESALETLFSAALQQQKVNRLKDLSLAS